ncbi:MAG: hypothetical protein CVV42_09290 [Candidatus Riflebacteria bacterium HGW-Riflebacteria-2]|jgi:prepilin-type N-terminal cleavage/methylation domain-containing protein|nr:MAG: hypothetical protein CVV42_09290 [Candidatus Riflebacteria bacterium HGW-Riflebacteria-2]
MKTQRSGFTLMEIMVVIIVIAVLASVAGPMIGSITDQGRSSATKANLSSLKSALLSFQRDAGRFPVGGGPVFNISLKANYNNLANAKIVFSATSVNNVLVNDHNYMTLGGYDRRYKGPYMDANPEDFMYDSWGTALEYFAEGNTLYLRSRGVNGFAEGVNNIINMSDELKEEADVDDILVPITRARRAYQ